jgi:DNA-directed RNA polymerase specialized sigma24 family protein
MQRLRVPHSDNTYKEDTINRFSSSSPLGEWKLTEEAFNKLLSSLSPDREEAANRYELLRRKLIRFCESNGTTSAEDGADEIINRVIRKIDEGTSITNVFAYAFGVARMLLKEFWKERERTSLVEKELNANTKSDSKPDDDDARIHCFDTCLEKLSNESRKLILDYYREDRRAKIDLRKELATQLSIPLNALRIRAHRVRKGLEQCVGDCLTALKEV